MSVAPTPPARCHGFREAEEEEDRPQTRCPGPAMPPRPGLGAQSALNALSGPSACLSLIDVPGRATAMLRPGWDWSQVPGEWIKNSHSPLSTKIRIRTAVMLSEKRSALVGEEWICPRSPLPSQRKRASHSS